MLGRNTEAKPETAFIRFALIGVLFAMVLCAAMGAPCQAFADTPKKDGQSFIADLGYQEFRISHEDYSYELAYSYASSLPATYAYKSTIKPGDTLTFAQEGGTGSLYDDNGLSLIPGGDEEGDTHEPDPTPQTTDAGDYEYYIEVDGSYVAQMPSSSNRGFTANYANYQVKQNDRQITVYARCKDESILVVFDVGDPSGMFVTENSTANNDSSGKEVGFAIPVAIGVAIAGAAAVGIALSRRGKSNAPKSKAKNNQQQQQQNNEDESCTYELRIAKNFGNTIYIGDPAVQIMTRVVKNSAQAWGVTDANLTRMISIKSGSQNIRVGSVIDSGGYKQASITAVDTGQASGTDQTGIVEVSVMTPAAGYTNRVHFRVVSRDPKIRFPKDDFFPVIAGDDELRSIRFIIENVNTPPDDITFETSDDLKAYYEVTKYGDYELRLQNKTAPFDKPFYKEERRNIAMHVRYGEKDTVVNVPVYLYPEGLSLRSKKVKDGKLELPSYKQKNSDGQDEMRPIEFELFFTYNDPVINGTTKTHFLDMSTATVKIESFSATEDHARRVLQKYTCSLDCRTADTGTFFITPDQTVPAYYHIVSGRNVAPDIKYFGTMKLNMTRAHYFIDADGRRNSRGHNETIEVPIHVIGQPFDALASWKKEYADLVHSINIFIDDEEQKQKALAFLDMYGKNATPTELYMKRNALFISARNRWMADSAIAMAESRSWDYMIAAADSVKFAGDVAFSYLAIVYVGPFGEAILSPCKSIVESFIGEIGATIIMGGAVNWDHLSIVEDFNNVGYNLIMLMYDAKSPTKMRLAAKVLAYMYVFNVVYHYTTDVDADGKRSWYKAFFTAFKNVGVGMAKILAGEAFRKLMANPKIKEKIFSKVGSWLQSHISARITQAFASEKTVGWFTDEVTVTFKDFAKKLIEELAGKGAGYVYDRATAPSAPAGPTETDIPIEVSDGERVKEYVARIDMGKVILTDNPASQAVFEDLFGWWYQEPANTSIDSWPTAPVVPDDIAEGRRR